MARLLLTGGSLFVLKFCRICWFSLWRWFLCELNRAPNSQCQFARLRKIAKRSEFEANSEHNYKGLKFGWLTCEKIDHSSFSRHHRISWTPLIDPKFTISFREEKKLEFADEHDQENRRLCFHSSDLSKRNKTRALSLTELNVKRSASMISRFWIIFVFSCEFF